MEMRIVAPDATGARERRQMRPGRAIGASRTSTTWLVIPEEREDDRAAAAARADVEAHLSVVDLRCASCGYGVIVLGSERRPSALALARVGVES
jgi:hypothetical protein